MNGGERTSLDRLDAVTLPADVGKVTECVGGYAGASVPDGKSESPNIPGRGGIVQLRSHEASSGPAGTMVAGYS